MSAVKGQYDFKNSEQLQPIIGGAGPLTSTQLNSNGFHQMSSQTSMYPRAQGCLLPSNNSQQISTQGSLLTNLNNNLQSHYPANSGHGRISPSAAANQTQQIRGQQQAADFNQKMVRSFNGLGGHNWRQNQFTFVTGCSPRKSAIPVTEAEKKGKIDNLSQFVEGVPVT